MEMMEKPETKEEMDNATMSHFIDWATRFIAPVCRWTRRICVHLSHGETKEEETEISRRAVWEDVETVTVGTGELTGGSRRLLLAQHDLEKKYSRWNNVLTVELFIRLYIDVRWHWSAYNHSRASARAVHSIRFHFTVPELHIVPVQREARVSIGCGSSHLIFSIFCFSFPLVHPETLFITHQGNKIQFLSSCCLDTGQ